VLAGSAVAVLALALNGKADRVTTYKTYHGTHRGEFLGVAPTGRTIQFETVDVMRVRDGKITEHWGVANLFSLLQQLGAWPPATAARS
jgi:predicted ester cyclase